MTISADIDKKRADLLRQAARAAATGDSATLFALTSELHRIESILAALSAAESAARAALSGERAEHVEPAPRTPRVQGHGPASAGRATGARVREEFLSRAKVAGLEPLPYRGAIYRTAAGTRVGTAVATERHRDRWFLGLGDDAFDSAVLLCVADDGRTYDVCLPAAFFAQHGEHLSRAGGQIKFNVARRGSSLILKIPRHEPVVVDRYLGAYGGLA